jgi:hypothetical protein
MGSLLQLTAWTRDEPGAVAAFEASSPDSNWATRRL